MKTKKKTIIAVIATTLFSVTTANAQIYNRSSSTSNSQSSDVSMYYAGIEAMRNSNFKDYTYVMNLDNNIFATGDCVYVSKSGLLDPILEKDRAIQIQGNHRMNTHDLKMQVSKIFAPTRLVGSIALSNIIDKSSAKISAMDYNAAVKYLTLQVNANWLVEYNNVLNTHEIPDYINIYFDSISGVDANIEMCPIDGLTFSNGMTRPDLPFGAGLLPFFKRVDNFAHIIVGSNINNGTATTVTNGLRAWHSELIASKYVIGLADNKFYVLKNNQVWFGPDSINGKKISIGSSKSRGTNQNQKLGE